MNQFYDVLLFVALKLSLLVGFIIAIKYWINKTKSQTPYYVYWIIGLFCVFMMSYSIFLTTLMVTVYQENAELRDKDSLGSLSALLAIIFYILVGNTYSGAYPPTLE